MSKKSNNPEEIFKSCNVGFEIKDKSGRVKPFALYNPKHEHDSCGVGLIARIGEGKNYSIVEMALQMLINLEHRGAKGADKSTGDGAGILLQKPDKFFRSKESKTGFELPDKDDYAVGMVFLPSDEKSMGVCKKIVKEVIESEGMSVIGWRDVPLDLKHVGKLAKCCRPHIAQVFVGRKVVGSNDFENRLYIARKSIETELNKIKDQDYSQFYICSLSCHTIVYKGMLTATQLSKFYTDLKLPDFESDFAIVHQRYSTNTLPRWSLAQPFRVLAHNGEINTLGGNVNRMKGRESKLSSPLFGKCVNKIRPVIGKHGSDSSMLDNVLELLVSGGRSIPHAMMMVLPQAYTNHFHMGQDQRAFYEYHSTFMEPWDGPASIVFTDGHQYIGGTLDRNGLRPGRYTITSDGLLIMASETGTIDLPEKKILFRGRLKSDEMLLIDLKRKRVVSDREIKGKIFRQKPYRKWLNENRIELRGLLDPVNMTTISPEELRIKQHVFGYTEEDLRMILAPMATNAQEAIGSMGNDAPLAVLSEQPQLLFNYFKQLFAQVTNPPIDSLREELVMSLMSYIGCEKNILDETPKHCELLKLHHPILTPEDMLIIRRTKNSKINSVDLDILFSTDGEGLDLEGRLEQITHAAVRAIEGGANLIVLTDRNMDSKSAPIPSLLAVSSLHHDLIRKGLRTDVGLIIETGEAREVMHFACLIAYGANAISPYLGFSTVKDLAEKGMLCKEITVEQSIDNYITAIKKGILKTLGRMGISTIRSFLGSQIFEVVGISKDVVDKYFTSTDTRIEGIGLNEIAREVLIRHQKGFPVAGKPAHLLDFGGKYHLRLQGEKHLMTPEAIHLLQQAVQKNDYEIFKKYSDHINDQASKNLTLRSLFGLKKENSIPIDEVEPVESIVKRFFCSAMSFGSLSKEAHETIAIGVNRAGARSNSGEGGESRERYNVRSNGDRAISRVKQVASGRFGVTTEYLINCEEIQIKVAQGAKPGEGGQLPGDKVTGEIAWVRNTSPGVTLISPPPHHDIYSIEDLAQLIYDLKCVNKHARVSVKLVSELGVGTIAAGVAKAGADMVQISGGDGGTGASPLTAIKHTGMPWEIGLAETQQTLVLNGLRKKIKIQTDGQLRTGRDLAIAAMMGAEEFGFATIILITIGCVMMRKCHSNTCPMGVATQDSKLREKFTGKPEYVERFLRFIASDMREIMAEMGFRTVDEMVGQTENIQVEKKMEHWKSKGLDLDVLLRSDFQDSFPRKCTQREYRKNVKCFDDDIIKEIMPKLSMGKKVVKKLAIRNVNRSVGARLSGEIARTYGSNALPENSVQLRFKGSAGQSLGAFLAPGITISVEGDCNDYLGKGMSGGKIIVVPPKKAPLVPHKNIIAGNVVLYGATKGQVFLNGRAGERFCVRNSGAVAVVEGVGNHGCEYMTGGTVVILGPTGSNFAAGMSGGIAYVYDDDGKFDTNCNLGMVDLEGVFRPEDKLQLTNLLLDHVKYTGSERAKYILLNIDSQLPYFVKVMPIDYKKALDRMRQSECWEDETVSATEEVFNDKGERFYETTL